MKTTRKNRAKRTIAGILAAASMLTALAAPVTVFAAEPDVKTGTTVTEDISFTMDDDLHAITQMTAQTIFKVLEECTPYGKFFTPALGILLDSTAGTVDPTQQKLDEINGKLDKMFDRIEQLDKDIKSTIETDLGLQSFYNELSKFSAETKKMNTKIKNAMTSSKMSNADKMAFIAHLTGKFDEWRAKYQDLLVHLNELFEDPSMTGKGNIFDFTYNHFAGTVMFTGEALDKSKPVCDYVMNVYTAGCTTILESLSAQIYVNNLSDGVKATIDPDYMAHICNKDDLINDEITEIVQPLLGVRDDAAEGGYNTANTFASLYQTMMDKPRTTFIYKNHRTPVVLETQLTGTYHRNVKKFDAEYCLEGSACKKSVDWFNNNVVKGQINGDQVKEMAKYAAGLGKSVRTLLEEVGFDTSNLPKNAKLITGNAFHDEDFPPPCIEWHYGYYYGVDIDTVGATESKIQFWHAGYNKWKFDHWNNYVNDSTFACRFQ